LWGLARAGRPKLEPAGRLCPMWAPDSASGHALQ
jgi:hypothetical protein